MTMIPSTGPLPVRTLTVRRDRRPDALLVAAGLTAVAIVVLVLASAVSGELTGTRLVVSLVLMTLDVLLVTIAAWLMRPRTLPPIVEYDPPRAPTDRGSVSPDQHGSSWPFR